MHLKTRSLIGMALLSLTLTAFAQTPQKPTAPQPTQTPPVKPAAYPIAPPDSNEYISLKQAADNSQNAFLSALQKTLTCRFASTDVLESVGQLREANQAAASAENRLAQWLATHKPGECPECVIAADAKSFIRPAK